MITRILTLPFILAGLLALRVNSPAAENPGRESVTLPYDILDPSAGMAKHYEKKGDFETAVLLYDAVLERDPSDEKSFRSMVKCYTSLENNEHGLPAENSKPRMSRDDVLSDLPDLIPADAANAQKRSDKPTSPLL
jgi:hypothetical protein